MANPNSDLKEFIRLFKQLKRCPCCSVDSCGSNRCEKAMEKINGLIRRVEKEAANAPN